MAGKTRHPIYPAQHGIGRRTFLKTTVGVSAAAATGSLLGLAPTRSAQAAGRQLTYAFWPWGSEIVTEDARDFAKQYGETINLQPIPGDYAAVLETKLSAKAPIDMFRAQRGQASRWYAAGWIRPIDDMPGLDKIKQEMYPKIVEDSKAWPDGKFMGLTYYDGGPFCLFRNEKVLAAAGYKATSNPADYPQTWDEVTKQARDIKKRGVVEHPILPGWYKAWTGTPWALYAHAYSEGEYFVDADMKATFGTDTPLLKVLSDWKQWWDEELVPRAILTWQDSQMSNSWMKGIHAFHPYIDYQSFIYTDPKNSEFHADFNMNPVMPGATHDTCLVGHALLCISNIKRSDADLERLWNLLRFFGWRDKNGELLAKKRWAIYANLEEPFPALYKDPAVEKAIKRWLYPPLVEPSYRWLLAGRKRAIAAALLRAPWLEQWERTMQDMVEQDMLINGTKSPKETVVALRKLWDQLHKRYT